MDWKSIPEDIEAALRSHRFDEEIFDQLRERLKAGDMGPRQNRLTCEVSTPGDRGWTTIPEPETDDRRELEAQGIQAIRQGKVGAVILNGGMATRFGGVVKCAVPVTKGRSFLDLKLSDIRAGGEGRVKTYLMNSFATDSRTRELIEEMGLSDQVVHFTQGIMLRVTPDGELFFESDGRPSPYAPGHGDLSEALRASGVLADFTRSGGELLLMSNVDNLGATLDPAIIGAHISLGGEMTVELVKKDTGDKGGAPAIVDGHLQIVEGFRFPEAFDQDSIPVFNTNTFVFDARALERESELTWFAVNKKVGGEPVVQFERLAGELTSFLSSKYLLVPREGNFGRFLPVKDPEELERRIPAIREVLRTHRVLG